MIIGADQGADHEDACKPPVKQTG
eukprot:COSAG06_NODE_37343_length_436_cov_0.970326_2_plen_23_part_01